MGDQEEGSIADIVDIGVAAALAHRYTADQRDFAIYLADLLESALPSGTKVQRRGGLFSPKEVAALSVHIDDLVYSLQVPARGPLAASRTKVVRGIKLKTEELPMEEWVAALGEHLGDLARRNQQTSNALSRMLSE